MQASPNSFICQSRPSIHSSTNYHPHTTGHYPTPHNISLPYLSRPYSRIYTSSQDRYITSSTVLSISPEKKKQSKWQPVCYNAVVPQPHIIADYPYCGIEYPCFRRNSHFRRYQSGKVPVNVLRGHMSRVSRICTTMIVSISFLLFFRLMYLNDIRHQTNYYSSRQPLPPT